jgi:hypothetical protein
LWGYWHCGHSWPIMPASGDSEDDCGEADVECRLAGETEVLGENLPQRHSCPSQNPTWPDPGLNPGRRGRKTTSNYATACPEMEMPCLDWTYVDLAVIFVCGASPNKCERVTLIHWSYQLAVTTEICGIRVYTAYTGGLACVCKYISHSGQCLLGEPASVSMSTPQSRGKHTKNRRKYVAVHSVKTQKTASDPGKSRRARQMAKSVRYVIVGATALGEPWLPLQPVSTWLLGFWTKFMGLLAPYPTPILDYQGVSLVSLFGLWGYWHCGHSWPIVPTSGDSEDDCGEADGM